MVSSPPGSGLTSSRSELAEAVRAAGERGGEAGGGTGLHERGADGVADEVVDEAGLAEADFGLGGVDVDVDLLRRHLEEEQDDGVRGGWEDVAVGLVEGVEDELVADEALVDEDVDGVAIEFLQLGLGDEAGEAEIAGIGWGVVVFALPGRWFGEAGAGEVELGGGGEHVVAGVFAEDLEEAVRCVGYCGGDEECLCRGVEFEVFCGVGEGVVGDQRGDVGELGLLGLEEFAAGGGVEEEIADGDGGADGKAGVFDAKDVATGDFYECAGGFFGDAGFELQAGDAGDGGKSFAAEAEGGDGEQIVGGAELGGGVALEGEEGVVVDHAVAVVGDADELAAAGFDLDADAGGAGVERVFEELFDDGGGAFDDFAGGDLVRHEVGEDADAAHEAIVRVGVRQP